MYVFTVRFKNMKWIHLMKYKYRFQYPFSIETNKVDWKQICADKYQDTSILSICKNSVLISVSFSGTFFIEDCVYVYLFICFLFFILPDLYSAFFM